MEVVTPTVDGDILAVLARAKGPFSGRQVHRLAGRWSEPGIRKGLDRLVAQGIVRRDKVGGTHLHTLNRDHLAADAITALAKLRESALSLMRDLLCAMPEPPELAALFGSAARGDETVESDLDILVMRPRRVQSETWESALSEFVTRVSAATGNDVRLLDLDAAELWLEENDALRTALQREAIVICGDSQMLTRRPL